mmetsp:Transcript_17608/g.16837  ORF Transcript_17608/g.16837 Transcript_17608/m.16837 type:complete len:100 (+) Transcript_17608:645-944(+)|eukprot:CAMPEP_0170547738 /NCGR_PEP_ID=MMETSP0211-20121228/6084_1 /TAXON_ID=311385 /ORGANISM="Pseudokeronopsis sp., Strain OXSARD2" /LENGTH=99 /DNA_ID=CAMNT_0010852899 /DNA_START=593 /DNA_END=892 /DNA_ORIENTATION=+
MYEEERKKFENLEKDLEGKIDGEIFMDMQGNLSFKDTEGGLKESGTYVLRDGKLVRGEGEKREMAQYSNWYCSNADPEDIRRHRELMDRMSYKGPQWEG